MRCLLCLIWWGHTAAFSTFFDKSAFWNSEEFQVPVKASQTHILPSTVQGKGSGWKQRAGLGRRIRDRFEVVQQAETSNQWRTCPEQLTKEIQQHRQNSHWRTALRSSKHQKLVMFSGRSKSILQWQLSKSPIRTTTYSFHHHHHPLPSRPRQFVAGTRCAQEWEQHNRAERSPVQLGYSRVHSNPSSYQAFRFLEILNFCIWKTGGFNVLIE